MKKPVKSMLAKLRSSKKGQGMTEYIIIVALIAIAAIGVISVFGDNIRAQFGNAAAALGGGQGNQYEAKDNVGEAAAHKDMGDFGDTANQEF